MTADDLSAVIRAIAPVIRDYVNSEFSKMAERLEMAEKQWAVKGPCPPGPPGPVGPPGKDGASLRVGEGTPAQDGKPGDVYLDVATGDIYTWPGN